MELEISHLLVTVFMSGSNGLWLPSATQNFRNHLFHPNLTLYILTLGRGVAVILATLCK